MMIWQEVRDSDLQKYAFVSLYYVDLLSLAIGPIKHVIEMYSKGKMLNSHHH